MVSPVRRAAAAALTATTAAALSAAVAAPAAAAPRTIEVTARLGLQLGLAGAGCVAETVSAPTAARRALRIEPATGADPGGGKGLVVTEAGVSGGRVEWSVAPGPEACEANATRPDWPWRVPSRSWAITYKTRAYALVASRSGTVRSLAGLRVGGRPNVAAASRVLGRPTTVRPTPGAARLACDARWARIGLTIKFTTFGGGAPCSVGVAQAATVTGSRARRWVALVEGSPAIPHGSQLRFLSARGLAERDAYGRRTWTLADVHTPYGEGGAVPSVMAQVGDGEVTGFEAWIGGAGD